jgi:bacteriophage CI repressor helix-turn-helix domain
MKNFTDQLNRLKTELSLTMDKDVAQFLGLSKSAFAERKRRGVFPEEALRLADLANPHLKLNVEYILTGKKEDTHSFLNKISKNAIETSDDYLTEEVFITPQNADTNVLLNFEETLLLSNYRRSSSKEKKAIFDMAKMCCDLSIARMRLNEYIEKDQLKEKDFTE